VPHAKWARGIEDYTSIHRDRYHASCPLQAVSEPAGEGMHCGQEGEMVRERVRGAGGNEPNLSCPSTKEFAEVPGFLYEGVSAN